MSDERKKELLKIMTDAASVPLVEGMKRIITLKNNSLFPILYHEEITIQEIIEATQNSIWEELEKLKYFK